MNDTKLINLIRQNDEDAIKELIEKFSKLLWKVADGILGSSGSAQDIEECVADVFIQLWNNPDSFDPSKSSLKTWLCLVCKNKAIDRFRALNRHTDLSLDELGTADFFGPEAALLKKEELAQLEAAVGALDGDERDVVIKRLYEGLKPSEIAESTGLELRRVENLLYRAKSKIRNSLKG